MIGRAVHAEGIDVQLVSAWPGMGIGIGIGIFGFPPSG